MKSFIVWFLLCLGHALIGVAALIFNTVHYFLVLDGAGSLYILFFSSPTLYWMLGTDFPFSLVSWGESIVETLCFYTDNLVVLGVNTLEASFFDLVDASLLAFLYMLGLVGATRGFFATVNYGWVYVVADILLFFGLLFASGVFFYLLTVLGFLGGFGSVWTDPLAVFEEIVDTFSPELASVWGRWLGFALLLSFLCSFFFPFAAWQPRLSRWIALGGALVFIVCFDLSVGWGLLLFGGREVLVFLFFLWREYF